MKFRIGDFKIELCSDEYKTINLILYSARRLIGSRIIESAAYCNRILLVPLYRNSTQKRRFIESLGGCYHFYVGTQRFF